MRTFNATFSGPKEADLQKALEVIGQKFGQALIPGPIKPFESAFASGFSCRCQVLLTDDFNFPEFSDKKSK